MENQRESVSVNGSNFAMNLCEKLQAFALDGLFSDICLKTSDGVIFHAHKIIMSASSEYFMAMFGSNMQESFANEVQLHNVTSEDFQPIITFLYTGKIKLESDKVEQILWTANFFQISTLINQCYYFMGELLDTRNWSNIALFAHQNEFADLFATIIKYLNKNSEIIINEGNFLSLDDDLIHAIVSHNDLNVNSEEELFFNLVRWMEYDRQNREKKALKLFTAIRYWRLTSDFIKREKSKLPDEVEYLKMTCSWLEWHSLSPEQRTLRPIGLFDPKEEINRLLLFGSEKIQIYNEKLNNWTVRRCSNLPKNHVGQVIAFKNKLIFSKTWGSLHLFDLQTGKVADLPPVNNNYSYSIAICYNELYLISGSDNYPSRKFNFCSSKCEWSDIDSPNRINESLQAIVRNGHLRLFGNDMNSQWLEPGRKIWRVDCIQNIIGDNSLFIAIGNDLYKIHGGNPWGFPNIIEKYDAKHQNIPKRLGRTEFDMLTLQCVSWKNRLVFYGRTCDRKTIVQEFNPDTNKWRTLPFLIDEDDSYTLVPPYE